MTDYYLAIDIGASGGRHILGHLQDDILITEEVYRFENEMISKDCHLLWDCDRLFKEICNGLAQCKSIGKLPKSVAVDTWGVDYVLLDENGERLGESYAYRDERTAGMDIEVENLISAAELYQRTGIQKLSFNTIYQLMALKKQYPQQLEKAAHFLMLPDYFHYLLSGVISNEYTNATTTQLVAVATKDWDRELISSLGINEKIFKELSLPGRVLGPLRQELVDQLGFSCQVVLPATHDTGSAYMAIPADDDDHAYLSSGTWSLLGCELPEAITDLQSRKANYSNEGGYQYRYRYLKNIMGLWMLQCLRKELPEKLSYPQLYQAARQSDIVSLVDCDQERFLAPASMIAEIQESCRQSRQRVPENAGELAAVIYHSLVASYQKNFKELSKLTGKSFKGLHIVGGGCQDEYLNQLTAKALQLPVFAGPIEATALGNLSAQLISDGKFKNLQEARSCIRRSFEVKTIIE